MRRSCAHARDDDVLIIQPIGGIGLPTSALRLVHRLEREILYAPALQLGRKTYRHGRITLKPPAVNAIQLIFRNLAVQRGRHKRDDDMQTVSPETFDETAKIGTELSPVFLSGIVEERTDIDRKPDVIEAACAQARDAEIVFGAGAAGKWIVRIASPATAGNVKT